MKDPQAYLDAVAAMKVNPKALTIMIADVGGVVTDYFGLLELWEGLRPDLDAESHREVTRAWLATCAFSRECDRERQTLRRFILDTIEARGWGRADRR
jgi:hypothetical protein